MRLAIPKLSTLTEAVGVVIRGGEDDNDSGPLSCLSELKLINFAWLTVLASLGLSLLGVYAIDIAEQELPNAALALPASKQLVFLF